jgi:hypothetical protein
MSSTDAVRIDTALGFHQVFRPIKCTPSTQRPKLDVEFKWGEAKLRFTGPNQLDIADQAVLLAVLEVTQSDRKKAQTDGEKAGQAYLANWLGHTNMADWGSGVLVATSFRRLAQLSKDSGSDGGSATTHVRESLTRLAETTVWARLGKVTTSSRMLAWEVGDDEKVLLSLNWRLVGALLGRAYTKISLAQRYMLPKQVAKALHFVLSCQVRPGGTVQYRIDTLQAHIWGEAPSKEALRQRRTRLLPALAAVGALEGWSINIEGPLAKIHRRKATAD